MRDYGTQRTLERGVMKLVDTFNPFKGAVLLTAMFWIPVIFVGEQAYRLAFIGTTIYGLLFLVDDLMRRKDEQMATVFAVCIPVAGLTYELGPIRFALVTIAIAAMFGVVIVSRSENAIARINKWAAVDYRLQALAMLEQARREYENGM